MDRRSFLQLASSALAALVLQPKIFGKSEKPKTSAFIPEWVSFTETIISVPYGCGKRFVVFQNGCVKRCVAGGNANDSISPAAPFLAPDFQHVWFDIPQPQSDCAMVYGTSWRYEIEVSDIPMAIMKLLDANPDRVLGEYGRFGKGWKQTEYNIEGSWDRVHLKQITKIKYERIQA